MTDLDTMIRTCLQEHADLAPPYDDPVTGTHARSRRIGGRQQVLLAAATAAVVAAGVTVGVTVSGGDPAGRTHSTVLTQGSSRPSPKSLSCPSGQVPNMAVNQSTAPRPIRSLVQQGPARASISYVVGEGVVFLVNGKPAAHRALLILVRPAGSEHTRYVVTKPGWMSPGHTSSPDTATDYVESADGWLATFSGCRSPVS